MTLRNKYDEAMRLKEKGDYDSAQVLLEELHGLSPTSVSVLATLADVFWELGQHDEAVSAFRKAVGLKPDSEAVSLGLFHCLWEMEHTDAAFQEMKRYLKDHDSEEYARLLADINKNQ